MEVMLSKTKHRLAYIVSYLIFALGGVSFFSVPHYMKLIIGTLCFVVGLWYRKEMHIKTVFLLLYVVIIVGIQAIIFEGRFFADISFGIVTMYVIPYFALVILEEKFPKYFIDIMYFFARIGFVFYFLSVVFPPFHFFTSTLAGILHTDPIEGVSHGFILYSYEPYYSSILRSPGPFFEPGAYSIYLLLAIVFNFLLNGAMFDKKNIVFIIANITTFSTAGFVSMVIVIMYFYYLKNRGKIKVPIVLFLLTLGFGYIFFNTNFLAEKIESQYEVQTGRSLNEETGGRFMGARKSLYVMAKYPLLGRGAIGSTMADINSPEHSAYGFLNIGAKYGVLGLLLYLVCFYKGLKILKGQRSVNVFIIMMALLVSLFSQAMYFKPIFFMIVFLPLMNKGFRYKFFENNRINA